MLSGCTTDHCRGLPRYDCGAVILKEWAEADPRIVRFSDSRFLRRISGDYQMLEEPLRGTCGKLQHRVSCSRGHVGEYSERLSDKVIPQLIQ